MIPYPIIPCLAEPLNMGICGDADFYFKPRLHVGHFYSHWQRNTSDVAGIVEPECCTCSQEQVLQQNRWVNVAEYSSN